MPSYPQRPRSPLADATDTSISLTNMDYRGKPIYRHSTAMVPVLVCHQCQHASGTPTSWVQRAPVTKGDGDDDGTFVRLNIPQGQTGACADLYTQSNK